MATKMEYFAKLSDQTASDITRSHKNWISFLQTMARIYKYPFNEQLMIYAQRPEATACADFDVWNRRMGRYIRRGAEGIALIDTTGDNPKLRYVFDVADTAGNEMARRPNLWTYKPEHDQVVRKALMDRFEVGGITLADQLEETAKWIVDDYWHKHKTDILSIVDGSYLGAYDDEETIQYTFCEAATISAGYALMYRCGLNTSERYEPADFMQIFDFNTPLTVAALGSAVSESTEVILRQVEITIKKYEREKTSERSQNNERTELHPTRGLYDSQPAAVRADNHTSGKVREDAQEVSAGASSGPVERNVDERTVVSASEGDQRDSERTIGENGAGDVQRSGTDGTNENVRPHEMGGADEQSESTGRRSDSGGTGVRLTDPQIQLQQESFFPNETEQKEHIAEAESETVSPSAFSIPQEVIDHILRIGSNTENHRMMIAYEFSKDKSETSQAEYLRSIYHGGYGIERNNTTTSAWFAADGIHLTAEREARYVGSAQIMAWEDVAKRINELLALGEFATNVELTEAPGFERQKLAESLWYLTSDLSDIGRDQGLLESIVELRGGFPDETRMISEMLADPDRLVKVREEFQAFMEAYERDPDVLRFHYHKPNQIQNRLSELDMERTEYSSSLSEIPAVSSFITEDEIDSAIVRGSGVAGGKTRIFEYFKDEHSSKEKADFLKKEYGIGGRAPAVSDAMHSEESHDFKGETFKKQNCKDVHLSWDKVVARVENLIQKDRYLSKEEREELEKIQESRKEDMIDTAIPEAKEAETVKKPARVSKEEINHAVQHWNGDIESKHAVVRYMKLHEREKETAEWLKGQFGTDSFTVSGQEIPWTRVQRSIAQLIREDQFYTQEEFDNFDNIDPVAIREDLQERGIVNGVRVQPVTPENDPFLSQVMEDVQRIAEKDSVREENPYKVNEEDLAYAKENLLPGETVFTWDDRRFMVDQVDTVFGTVELKDLTFVESAGFPIFRTEPIAKVREYLESMPNDPVIENVQEPELRGEAVNFRIEDTHLGEGGPKAKYIDNIRAIQTLKQLEREDRYAEPDEQEILSRYVGWGGLADAFDSEKTNWTKEYQELKEILTPQEYESARGSTLNAHYTSPTVIQAIYEAIGQMGFRTGNVLEPACGVGNFFGMIPEQMQASRLYGVELDSVSGRIAQKLYPKANITVAGFETTDRRDFFDLAVGNVPFGNYKVSDKPYDKLGFSIHNYFLAKSLDQIRPGGIMAFVTSRYTMDSKNSAARRYLAQRADFLGAIRLPNDAFKGNAGASVVSDIIFLQKRDRPLDIVPEWTYTQQNASGHEVNRYFVDHPEMVLGVEAEESTAFGKGYTVNASQDVSLKEQLSQAIKNIGGVYQEAELPELGESDSIDQSIPADPDVKNYSYTLVDGNVYYRENSRMVRPDLNSKAEERVKGMIQMRDCVHTLMDMQMDAAVSDDEIHSQQETLNDIYDSFSKKFGLINDRVNQRAFSDDSSYYLLCALEELDENRNLKRKADMFTKRTIKPHQPVTSVDTASEALAVSISEKACVDMPYMTELTGKTEEEIFEELQGVVFQVPRHTDDLSALEYVTSDEYLSGNVRQKLREAQEAAEKNPVYLVNVEALQAAQPKDLDASEIEVRLGATWISKEYIQQFMEEVFDTPWYQRRNIKVNYSPFTAEWQISGKSNIPYNDIAAHTTYGTDRASAYKILEESLNLRDVRIYDTVEDADGKERRVLNAKETTLAAQKQEMIREAFKDWIWRDPERRQTLVRQYNEEMNSTRPREYNGDHLVFGGINPEITLREHQKNAIAHVIYGGNTLLAHEVGAGKTYEMVAAAMEAKRLGLCTKSMFVVPNHLTEQWASEFLRLYPAANILVTNRKDFEPQNRKKFCGRIATGDYDAVIIGHSQFEKIPISMERQERLLQEQIDEITEGIEEVEASGGERFTVKQLERTKKGLEQRLEKLQAQDRKDDVVTFEQLGVDRLFVDEAHSYKNLFLYTKMRNVAGLSTSDAQKSSDMFAKCRYMDEITGSRGVIFATGTPVSNSMTELYTMQRYLQYDRLKELNMTHFDCWASRFGETVTALELAPEGTGYRARTRFSKFFNLPELMTIFREVADIKTADQLHLPTPEVEYHNVVAKPTEHQQEMVKSLSERAALVHSGSIDPSQDNMLKITSDGRKLGLDQRIVNDLLPDEPGTKVNQCVDNILQIWKNGQEEKLTQLVFCDISTPKSAVTKRAAKAMENPSLQVPEEAEPAQSKGQEFTVYEDIRQKLIARGMPADQIAFIHEANTEERKKNLFSKVRTGQVRVLIGSTSKMGAGTNVQDRLVALHDLDCPWRPGDLAQRKGRIERQGNQNKQVHVFRYVTEGTFDAYLWQTVENKQRFISQIMSSKSPVRSCEDVDETALSFAEIKALCAGDPRIKERMDLDVEVSRLKLMKADHKSKMYRLEDQILRTFPEQIEQDRGFLKAVDSDLTVLSENAHPVNGFAGMEVRGDLLTDKENAGAALLDACKDIRTTEPVLIGSYRGFAMLASFDAFNKEYQLTLKGQMSHKVSLGPDPRGNLVRMDNALAAMPERKEALKVHLDNLLKQQAAAKEEVKKEFPYEAELETKMARLIELDGMLNMDGRGSERAAEPSNKCNKPSVLEKLKSHRALNVQSKPGQRETEVR